ncbi:MAG: ribonuclease III [Lachnospiraceae bacterium]|nr:ribonuclease III [Lachnospiraceae bacterium]
MSDRISELESVIGYNFNNIEYLYTAITHTSYANENKMSGISHNERLEFLGDAVLELISSEILFKKYPDMAEGKMTRLRASLVCEPTLAMDAREIDLGSYLRLGKGEEATGGRGRDSVTSDALEAVIGAIYLDGGLESARAFINKYVMNDIENKKLFSDSKTHLQELVASDGSEYDLHYDIVSESGPDHNKSYVANVVINGKIMGAGEGKTKKAAEQKAAWEAIKSLDKRQ